MKIIYSTLVLTFAIFYSYAQNATYDNLVINNSIIKTNGAADLSGWGVATDNTLDPRPNYVGTGPFMINNHYGLTFSAHTYYGGIRFYNQGYPTGYSVANGATMVMSLTNNRVGIGTSNPQNPMTIKGLSSWGTIKLLPNADNQESTLAISSRASETDISNVWLLGSGAWGAGTSLTIGNSSFGGSLMAFATNGNVSVGTTDSKGYKFAVNGNVIATSVTVKLNSAWPDYVFKKEYKLPTLTEVKKYIDENQHLPGMPSEKEVADNGLNLGEINQILTKKMEELTLYLIEKDQQLKNQQEELNQLKKQFQEFKEQY